MTLQLFLLFTHDPLLNWAYMPTKNHPSPSLKLTIYNLHVLWTSFRARRLCILDYPALVLPEKEVDVQWYWHPQAGEGAMKVFSRPVRNYTHSHNQKSPMSDNVWYGFTRSDLHLVSCYIHTPQSTINPLSMHYMWALRGWILHIYLHNCSIMSKTLLQQKATQSPVFYLLVVSSFVICEVSEY